jgi:hypothetical protein
MMQMGAGADEAPESAPPSSVAPTQPRVSPLARFGEIGAVAQATVPGLYAWIVTVAPAAWARGAPFTAKALALIGLALLLGAAGAESRWQKWARITSIWGLVSTSALVWAIAPAALGVTRLDTARGITGMIGWALFAYASAAPALKRVPRPADDVVIPGRERRTDALKPKTRISKGDTWFVAGGVVLAIALQAIGWHVVTAERGLLVRLVTLAAGLGVIGTATSVALARHPARVRAPSRRRFRVAVPWLAATVVLAAGGFLLWAVR